MQCQSCMMGTYVNGVCSHCHRRQKSAAARDPSALPLGLVLHQRYRLGDVLGRGGFGITYAAWDLCQNLPVAIKELFPKQDVRREGDGKTVAVLRGQEAYFAQISQRFSQEATLLLKLQENRSVVRVYRLFSENNTVYYVMEYLDGLDLNAWLQQHGPMPWARLSGIIAAVLDALEALHTVGLIHRDLSPDNIFLTRDGTVRLIDFGSVRAYEDSSHFTVFVKKSFAPWEQYQTNSAQGPWTDIYSLCVTMYFALSGKLPPMASERRAPGSGRAHPGTVPGASPACGRRHHLRHGCAGRGTLPERGAAAPAALSSRPPQRQAHRTLPSALPQGAICRQTLAADAWKALPGGASAGLRRGLSSGDQGREPPAMLLPPGCRGAASGAGRGLELRHLFRRQRARHAP